jgi:hypothetical protein
VILSHFSVFFPVICSRPVLALIVIHRAKSRAGFLDDDLTRLEAG